MLNRTRLLAVAAFGLLGGAVAFSQWSSWTDESTAATTTEASAELAEKLLKSRMTYGDIDQSVLKVDPAQQLAMQTRVDEHAALGRSVSSGQRSDSQTTTSQRSTAESKASATTGAQLPETLTADASVLAGLRGEKTRWARLDFDAEAAMTTVSPIGWVASAFAGGGSVSPWAISGGSMSASRSFNWPTSLEQSAASLSSVVADNAAAATTAPAKTNVEDTAPDATATVQSSVEVDEPGNWSLMAIGLLLLLAWRQRRNAIRAE